MIVLVNLNNILARALLIATQKMVIVVSFPDVLSLAENNARRHRNRN